MKIIPFRSNMAYFSNGTEGEKLDCCASVFSASVFSCERLPVLDACCIISQKSGGKLSPRGRHTAEDRQERLNFVGAVVAQLLERGQATHHGLKKYLSGTTEFDPREAFGAQRPNWSKPSPAVWGEIEASPHNADCLAIAAAYIGKLVAVKRHGSLRGKQHFDSRPQREGSNMTYWQAIEGMTKQTAHYWKKRREKDYSKAFLWLAMLLKRNGLSESPAKAGATVRKTFAEAKPDAADKEEGSR